MSDWNTGYCNTGNRNTGYCNTGNWNTGYSNTGNWNTGYSNTGYSNTGDCNTGYWNTGDWNTGNWNTGYWNTGDCNTGYFCTITQTATFFDKPTTLTHEEARKLIPFVELPIGAVWIASSDMSDDEKAANPDHEHVGGCLRKYELPYTESFPLAWAKMSGDERAKWTSLPNFDADKFLTITGVDVREPTTRKITIDGTDVTISEESYQALKEQLLN